MISLFRYFSPPFIIFKEKKKDKALSLSKENIVSQINYLTKIQLNKIIKRRFIKLLMTSRLYRLTHKQKGQPMIRFKKYLKKRGKARRKGFLERLQMTC